MSFFIDKQGRRKSPIALAAFGAALAYLVIFGLLYAYLAEPLYNAVRFESAGLTNAVHSLCIALLGTAIGCVFFLLPDKRVPPYGFAGLGVALGMFYAAALMMEGQERINLLYLITAYGLAPVLVGNAVTWPIYLKIKRANPALNHRKTVAQELREAIEKDAARKAKKGKTPKAAAEPEAKKEVSPAAPDISPEEALFGPEEGRSWRGSRSAQDEAMLLFVDDDEEESDNS